jgi:hypothetical protein
MARRFSFGSLARWHAHPMTRLSLALAVAAATLVAAPIAASAMPPAAQWEIGPWVKGRNYSVGMPEHPSTAADEAVAFAFPLAGRGQIDAMTIATPPLEGARRITLSYRIDAEPGTRFIPDEARSETATVSLYVQRAGDNWTAKGPYASYRWYVPARAVIPLSPGRHSVTIGFDEPWTNVYGASNRADPEGYTAALAETSRIGIAFGSLSMRSHGVFATAPATFTLLALDVE